MMGSAAMRDLEFLDVNDALLRNVAEFASICEDGVSGVDVEWYAEDV